MHLVRTFGGEFLVLLEQINRVDFLLTRVSRWRWGQMQRTWEVHRIFHLTQRELSWR
jgi:hypothetical protein